MAPPATGPKASNYGASTPPATGPKAPNYGASTPPATGPKAATPIAAGAAQIAMPRGIKNAIMGSQ